MSFQFSNFSDFIAMQGHGPYVWAAYGVALVVLTALVVWPLRRNRHLRTEVARQIRIEEARRRKGRAAAAGNVGREAVAS